MPDFKVQTRDEIYQGVLDNKNQYTSLDGLNDLAITDEQTLFNKLTSTIVTSIWILWGHLIAISAWVTQNYISDAIIEQEEVRDTSFFGNPDWVEYAVKLFQKDDEVTIYPETNKIGYDVIDESKQSIGSAVAVSAPGAALVKIRGIGTDILPPETLSQARIFWNRVGVLGVNYLIQNESPDIITILGTIRYKGEKSQGEIQTTVESTITDYIRNISFNSEFIKNELLKKVLDIDGVTDFEIDSIRAKTSTGTYSDVVFRYIALAGYLTIDSGLPLNQSLIYSIEKIY